MTKVEFTLAALGWLAMVATLALLLVRRLYQACVCLVLYLGISIVDSFLAIAWQGRFWTWSFYVIDRSICTLLKCGLAVEVSESVFAPFEGARSAMRPLMVIGMSLFVGTALAALSSKAPLQDLAAHFFAWFAVINGVLFAVVWLLAVWYHVPMYALHRAIVRGFAFLMIVQAVALGLIELSIWRLRQAATCLEECVFVLVMSYLGWVAWRSSIGPEGQLRFRGQPRRGRL